MIGVSGALTAAFRETPVRERLLFLLAVGALFQKRARPLGEKDHRFLEGHFGLLALVGGAPVGPSANHLAVVHASFGGARAQAVLTG